MAPGKKASQNPVVKSKSSTTNHSTTRFKNQYVGCGICRADHRIVTCKKFTDLSLEQKYKIVTQLHYCLNCMARNHLLDKCRNNARCRVCGLKHHTILHGYKKSPSNSTSSQQPRKEPKAEPPTNKSRNDIMALGLPSSFNKVLVPTAEVHAVTDDGVILLRAILNPSSTTSRIATSFVHEYRLKIFELDGKPYVKLTLMPNMSSLIRYDTCLLVVDNLPRRPYSRPISESIREKFEHFTLADPNFNSNALVELELGGDLYSRVLKCNVIQIGGSLITQDSTLGWLIMGPYAD